MRRLAEYYASIRGNSNGFARVSRNVIPIIFQFPEKSELNSLKTNCARFVPRQAALKCVY